MSRNRSRRKSDSLVKASPYAELLRFRGKHPYWERLSQGYALLILAFFPLWLGATRYGTMTNDKYMLFKFLTFLYACFLLLLFAACLFDRELWRERRKEGFQELSVPQMVLLVYTLWGVVCSVASPYPFNLEGYSRGEGVLSMLLYAFVFVVVSFWGEYSDYYLPAITCMAGVESFICILQLLRVNIIYWPGDTYLLSQFIGTLGNIDMMSALIVLILPALCCGFILLDTRWRYGMLAAASALLAIQLVIDVDSGKIGLAFGLLVTLPYLLTERRRMANTLYTAAALFFAGALSRVLRVFALSAPLGRSTWLMLGAAVVTAGAGYLTGRGGKPFAWKEGTIRLVVAAAEIVLVAAGMVWLYRYSGGNTLLLEIHDVLHGELADEAGSYRGYIWKNCIRFASESPVFGYGPGTFGEVFSSLTRIIDNKITSFDFAHNDFLHIAVSTGYVGLGIYVLFVLSLAVRALKGAARCPLVLIFASSVAAYLAHSFFSFSIAIISPVFWVMAGLLEKCVRQLPPKTD